MHALTQYLPAESANPILDQWLPVEKQAGDAWYIGSSDIEGQGAFAGRDYEPGEVIGKAMTNGGKDEWDSKIWNLTLLARHCNHQNDGNVEVKKNGDEFDLVASKPIGQDDELVANYRQVTRAAGPHSRMMWDGENIPETDLSDFVQKDENAETRDRAARVGEDS